MSLAASGAAEKPRIVPMPAPPQGPKIRRVSHDAVKPVLPGASVVVTVSAEPGMNATVAIGALVTAIACSPRSDDPSTYLCPATVPSGGDGPQRVRATVTNARGESSALSANLPLVVEPFDPWKEPNALNVRLAPAYFASGSADLDPAARAALSKDADALKAHAALAIAVEGHADPDEGGDLDVLSRRRAEAARDLLASLGVPAARMAVRPLGATQPLSAASVAETRPLNRRVMVVFEPAPAKTP
ncbi:MAG: OmpA family protein [Acidobacteria bacterium]|nr:OmpA family protein [Acidobacteriota bacterium]